MRRSITALVLAAFVAGIFGTSVLAATATTSKTVTTKKVAAKSTAKPKVTATTKPAAKSTAKPFSKTKKGLANGMTKATKFVKRTVTVPQKNPKAAKRNPNRKDSNLVKGLKTSSHKAGKWIKGRTKIK
jgi:hypothetical protein